MTQIDGAGLQDARIWIVTDGSAEASGWLVGLTEALRAEGAASVDVMGVSGAVGWTARNLVEAGAERIARTLRLSRRGQPDSNAADAFADARPDVVLVDSPGLLRPLVLMREASPVNPVIVGLISDLGPADAWVGARADAWIAADEALLVDFRGGELADAALQVAGPPLDASFGAARDRDALRAEFGVDDDFVVLLDASTMAAPLIDRAVFQLSVVRSPFKALFYYGRNPEAADVLRQSAKAHGLRGNMFGPSPDFADYAATADVVIIGASNPHLAGYLALHRPLIGIDPQVADSIAAGRGAAFVAQDVAELGAVIEEVASAGVSKGHQQAALELAHPGGNREVAAAVAVILANRHRLRISRAEAPRSSPSAAPRPGSRFEEIGGDDPVAVEPAPMSRAAAREQLAALIVEERKIEKEISGLVKERDRWFGRLQLAEEEKDAELAGIARERVDAVAQRLAQCNERRDGVLRQKDLIRRRAVRPGSSKGQAEPSTYGPAADVEARFREMEMRRDMNRLRRRAEGGEPQS